MGGFKLGRQHSLLNLLPSTRIKHFEEHFGTRLNYNCTMEMQKRPAHFLLPLLWLVAMMVIATQGRNIPRPGGQYINQQGVGISTGAANRRRMNMGQYSMGYPGYGMQSNFKGQYPMVQSYGKGQYPVGMQGYQMGLNSFGFQNQYGYGMQSGFKGQYPMVQGYGKGQYPVGMQGYQMGLNSFGFRGQYGGQYPNAYGSYF